MGGNYSKPYKRSPDKLIGAYQWDQKELGFGTNTFKLVKSPKKPTDDFFDLFPQIQAIIEPKLQLAVDIIKQTANREMIIGPKNFKETVSQMNSGWCADINTQLEQESLGCKVDAFKWSEWHSNGSTSRKRTFLVIRIMDVRVAS